MLNRKTLFSLRSLALVVSVIALTGCDGCGPTSGASSSLEVVGVDAQVAVSTGDLVGTARSLASFVRSATEKSASMASSLQTVTQSQLGFNPFEKAAYAEVGIDPKTGMAVFTEGDSTELVLALGITDQSKVNDWLLALLKRVDGASERSERTVDGVKIFSVGRPFGTELVPVAHWTFVGSRILISPPQGEASLIAAAKRLADGTQKSLSSDSLYSEMNAKIPSDSVLRVFARGGVSSVLTGSSQGEAAQAAMLGVTFDESSFASELFVKGATGKLGQAMGDETPASLSPQIADDAVFATMSAGARSEMLNALKAHPVSGPPVASTLRTFKERTGLDLEQDLVPLLSGPITLAIYIENASRAMAAIQSGGRDPSAMLEAIHASVTAKVKEPAAMAAVLDKAAERLRASGVAIERQDSERKGKPLIRFAPQQPTVQLGWALYGNTYVYGAGAGRVDRMLDVLDGASPSLSLKDTSAEPISSKAGASLILIRLGVLGEKVRSLANELGGAAGAAMFGQIVNSAVDVSKTLGDIAISVQVEPDGLRLQVRENLR
ncbi:MAG: hypothetical protein AAFP04_01400 [Myxococcota bacterium]